MGVPWGEIRGGCGGLRWGCGAGTAGYGVTRSRRLLGGTRGTHASSSPQFLVPVSPQPQLLGHGIALGSPLCSLSTFSAFGSGLLKKSTPQNFPETFRGCARSLRPARQRFRGWWHRHREGSALASPSPPSAREGTDGAGESPGRTCTKGSGAGWGARRAGAEPWGARLSAPAGSTPTAP